VHPWWLPTLSLGLDESFPKSQDEEKMDVPQAICHGLPISRIKLLQRAHELIFFEKVIQLPAPEFHSIDQIHGVVASWDNWNIYAWGYSQPIPSQFIGRFVK
jgi:hypothetical protein